LRIVVSQLESTVRLDRTMIRNSCQLAFIVLAALFLAPALCAQTTGHLTGIVLDNGGRPLAAATVTIESPFLIGGPRSQSTAEDGRFSFPAVAVGVYDVRIERERFAPQSVIDVEVHLRRTSEVQVQLSPTAVEERILVTSETPMVDPVQVSQGHVFTADYLRNAIVGTVNRSYLSVIKQAPGVVDSVLCSAPEDPNVFGSLGDENTYLIDGIHTNGPFDSSFSRLVNFDSIREISLETAGYEAEYLGTTGGIVSVVTKSGGNHFQGSLDLRHRDSDLDKSGDHFDPDREPNKDSRISTTFGGPILQDKLWFFGAADAIDSDYTPHEAKTTIQTEANNFLAKITWQIDPSWTLFGQYLAEPLKIHNDNSSPLVEPEATSSWEESGPTAQLDLTGLPSRRLLWNLKLALHRIEMSQGPESGDFDTAGRLQFVPSRFWHGNYAEALFIDETRNEIRTDLAIFASKDHSIKVGLSVSNPSERDESFLITDRYFTEVFGQPYGMWFIPRHGPAEFDGEVLGAFVQDAWRAHPGLTLKGGLRWDRARQENDLGQEIADLEKLQPRLGLAWKITEDGKTVARASWGRFMHPGSLKLASLVRSHVWGPEFLYLSCGYFAASEEECRRDNPGTLTFDGFAVDRWVEDPSGVDPAGFWLSDWFTFPWEQGSIDPGLDPMYADQLVFGVEREIFRRTSLELSYVRKATEDIFEDTCIGNYPIPSEGADCHTMILANLPGLERNYEGLILRFESRVEDWFHLLASYTYSKSQGNVESTILVSNDFNLYPEHWESRYGYLSDDRRHRLKLNGYFLLPFELTLGFEGRWLSEFPYSVIEPTLPYGDFFQEPRGSRRGGDHYGLDVELRKAFQVGLARLQLIGTVYNLPDREDPTGICDGVYGCGWEDRTYELGEPVFFTRPRQYEVGLRVEF
jgi:outer membrane receptor protein involved in Fe transport